MAPTSCKETTFLGENLRNKVTSHLVVYVSNPPLMLCGRNIPCSTTLLSIYSFQPPSLSSKTTPHASASSFELEPTDRLKTLDEKELIQIEWYKTRRIYRINFFSNQSRQNIALMDIGVLTASRFVCLFVRRVQRRYPRDVDRLRLEHCW